MFNCSTVQVHRVYQVVFYPGYPGTVPVLDLFFYTGKKKGPTPTQNKNHAVTNTTPIWQNHNCPEVHVTIKQKQQKSEHIAHKNTDKTKDERRKGIDATKLLCSNDGTKCLRITQS